jgi:hypothetical protein
MANVLSRADEQTSTTADALTAIMAGDVSAIRGEVVKEKPNKIDSYVVTKIDSAVKDMNDFGAAMFGVDPSTDINQGESTAADRMAAASLAKYENRYGRKTVGLNAGKSLVDPSQQYEG